MPCCLEENLMFIKIVVELYGFYTIMARNTKEYLKEYEF